MASWLDDAFVDEALAGHSEGLRRPVERLGDLRSSHRVGPGLRHNRHDLLLKVGRRRPACRVHGGQLVVREWQSSADGGDVEDLADGRVGGLPCGVREDLE